MSATMEIDASALLQSVQESDGTLVIANPASAIRASYRRAINQAITGGLVPDGLVLRHSGRDRGDLTVRLTPRQDLASTPERPPPVPVPHSITTTSPLVRDWARRGSWPGLSAEVWPRALLFLGAVAGETQRRGWTVLEDDRPGWFRIVVGRDVFSLLLGEEQERADVPDEEQQAALKYSWQRVRLESRMVGNGRLTLQMAEGYRPQRWADRKSWTLEDKLGEIFAVVQRQAEDASAARQRTADEARRRRELWEHSVPVAHARLAEAQNHARMAAQLVSWSQATSYRLYAATLRAAADSQQDVELAEAIAGWADQANAEATRLDPLNTPLELRPQVPSSAPVADLDRYMPEGMTVLRPPYEPQAT